MKSSNHEEDREGITVTATGSTREQRLNHDSLQNKQTPVNLSHSQPYIPNQNHVPSTVDNSSSQSSLSYVNSDSSSGSLRNRAGQDAYNDYSPYESSSTLEDEFTKVRLNIVLSIIVEEPVIGRLLFLLIYS